MANEADASCVAVAGCDGEEVATTSAGSSPKNRMKFLCSYGGKILPRPSDGHLKYVGGETRVVAIAKEINFSELMKKLKSEFEGAMVLKYQVIPDELDVLVSVKCDEDLKHMFDEYNRNEGEGTAKFRIFLFPLAPIMLDNQNAPTGPHAIEQRYVDALNNTVHSTANNKPPPISANRPTFSISDSSSPSGQSPDGNTADAMHPEHAFMGSYQNSNRYRMHKVHSSPSLHNLNALHQQSSSLSNHHYGQPHHYHYQHHPHSHHQSSLTSRPPYEHHKLSSSTLSGQRSEFGRVPFGLLNQHHLIVNNAGSSNVQRIGSSNKHGYYEEQHCACGCKGVDTLRSLPASPRNKILE